MESPLIRVFSSITGNTRRAIAYTHTHKLYITYEIYTRTHERVYYAQTHARARALTQTTKPHVT